MIHDSVTSKATTALDVPELRHKASAIAARAAQRSFLLGFALGYQGQSCGLSAPLIGDIGIVCVNVSLGLLTTEKH